MNTGSRGFTIVEVMLFLGISGLLLIGAFAGSSRLIADTRFTDSVRGLESFMQRQYEEVTNGVNPRGRLSCDSDGVSTGNQAPGKSDCLLLGKVVVFRTNSAAVEVFDVVGNRSESLPLNPNLEDMLIAYEPQIVEESRSVYDIPWGTRFTAGRRAADNQQVNAVAFLRSPVSSQIGTYHFSADAPVRDELRLRDSTISSVASSTTAGYCIEGQEGAAGRYRAAITFSRGQGSAAISFVTAGTGTLPC